MSEENEQTESVETQGAERQEADMVPRSELQKAIKKRQDAKSEAAQLRAELDEFRAQKEAEEKAAEEKRLRQQGENEKIIAAREEELAKANAELEGLKWGQRFSATTSAVAAASGQDADVVKGLLLLEKQERGTDVAPSELSDDGVAEFVDMLRKRAPSLFQTKSVGGTPGVAGGSGGLSETAQRAQRMGAQHIRK